MKHFPGRTADDDNAVKRRALAAAAWVRETFAHAKRKRAAAVVIGFHGDPAFGRPADDGYRLSYEPFMSALEEEIEKFGKPVLVVHGDEQDTTSSTGFLP